MKERTRYTSSDLSSDLSCSSPNQKINDRLRILRDKKGLSQKKTAEKIGIALSTMQSYERGSIPKGDHLIKLCLFFDVSADWLLFGRGEADSETPLLVQERPAPIYNDMEPEQAGAINVPAKGYKISELIQKTIEVLESDTVCKTALTSNIEAFHEYVMSQEQIDKLNSEIASQQKQLEHFQLQQTQMFQEMRKEMHSIRQENQQLRDEIQMDRDQEATKDTG